MTTGGQDVTIAVPEDHGSETLARYDYQARLTAYAGLQMLIDERIDKVVCEALEDYVVVWRDAPLEFVSVKHREPNRGVWTLSLLCGQEGAIRHLFQTWDSKNGQRGGMTCRLQTNAGLGRDVPALREVGADDDGSIAEPHKAAPAVAAKLFGRPFDKISTDKLALVAQFLEALTISAGLPKREDLRAKLLESKVPRIAKELKWKAGIEGACFDAICSEVWLAMKSDMQGARREAGLDVRPSQGAGSRDDAMARKTIDRARLAACLEAVRRGTYGAEKLSRRVRDRSGNEFEIRAGLDGPRLVAADSTWDSPPGVQLAVSADARVAATLKDRELRFAWVNRPVGVLDLWERPQDLAEVGDDARLLAVAMKGTSGVRCLVTDHEKTWLVFAHHNRPLALVEAAGEPSAAAAFVRDQPWTLRANTLHGPDPTLGRSFRGQIESFDVAGPIGAEVMTTVVMISDQRRLEVVIDPLGTRRRQLLGETGPIELNASLVRCLQDGNEVRSAWIPNTGTVITWDTEVVETEHGA